VKELCLDGGISTAKIRQDRSVQWLLKRNGVTTLPRCAGASPSWSLWSFNLSLAGSVLVAFSPSVSGPGKKKPIRDLYEHFVTIVTEL
jgi:hypothetical protein